MTRMGMLGSLVLAAAIAQPAMAQIAGDAANYNVFIFGSGSFVSSNTDTVGNLAAGGNVTLTNYSVAQGITGNPSATPDPARLVTGGTLTASYGSVGSNHEGAIYTNSTPNLTNFAATGGLHAQNLISSFSADQTEYTNLSASLDALTANGTSTLKSGDALDLTGTSSGLNVFDVTAATLSASEAINISAPVGSTVLINITGTSQVTFQNGSVTETGVSATSVLYNISSASVDLAGSKDPMGSILAPNAGVTGAYGSMTGQLITDSYSGNTDFNDALFTGNLSAVPSPPSISLMLVGMVSFGVLSWSRKGSTRLG